MWPKTVHWKNLKFGIEIEFIGGEPEQLELLPGWVMSLDELQIDETGAESGSELKPPPILWEERKQIEVMLTRLKEQGATANWSCGLHVHIGLEPWGQDIVLPLLDAALLYQNSIQTVMNTSEHRLLFCPPVTQEMRQRFITNPSPEAILHKGRPQSHRCGINLATWFEIHTVEIRYANGSLDYNEMLNTIEFCLRFVAAIGAGHKLPSDPGAMAMELGVAANGFPPAIPPPRWFKERSWLEDLLIPILKSHAADLIQDGEIHHIVPVPEGLLVAIENSDGKLSKYIFRPPADGWEAVRKINAAAGTSMK